MNDIVKFSQFSQAQTLSGAERVAFQSGPINAVFTLTQLTQFIRQSLGLGDAATAKKTDFDAAGAAAGVNTLSIQRDDALSERMDHLQQDIDNAKNGANSYRTLALAQAAVAAGDIPANTSLRVTLDPTTAKNGLYDYDGLSLEKSSADELTQAKAYADTTKTAAITAAATDAASKAATAESNAKTYTKNEVAKMANTITSKNLYNPAVKQINKYIVSTTGLIRDQPGWGIVLIPVVAGQKYTLSSNAPRRAGAAFYTDNTQADSSFIVESYVDAVTSAATAVTLTAPAGATYLGVNLYSTTVAEPTQFQVESGTTATAYTPYTEPTLAIKEDALPSNLVKQDQIPDLIKKPYEKVVTSKNLFNKNTVKDGNYLNSTTGNIMSAANWGMSAEIPVTAGQQVTLSFSARGRAGLAFFPDATTTVAIAGSYNGSTANPLTVTVPAGATHMRINLYQPSTPTFSDVQVELGSTATSYEPTSGTKTLVDASQIYNPSAGTAANTVTFSGQTVNVKSMVDGLPVEMSALLTIPATHDKSTVFNFSQDKFNNVVQRTMNDDAPPIRALGTTIGGNHGYLKTTITLAAHGKTNADVGSVWNSGGKQWVIVEIISTSQLSITSRTDNTGFVSGTLTHVSGATNTASMTPTAAADSAWHPVFKNRKLTCSIDGKPAAIADGTTEYRNNVTFNESYDIMLKSDMVEWLITHGGVAVMQYDAEASISLSMNYCFDIDGGCVITSDLLALKAVSQFTDFMLLQAIKMAAGNGAVEYIVPKSKAFTQDGVSYDFSYPTDIVAKNPANDINFNAAKNADGLTPVNRLLQRNDQVVFTVGFLPILDATPASRVTNAPNKYLQIRASSLKVYPALIDGLKTSLAAGDYFCGIGYRKYAKRTTDRTSAIPVRHKLGDFLIVDWHQAKTDSVSLPADYAGRSFEVAEKSANVEVLSKTATNRVVFRTNSAAPAFAVLLFK